MRLQGKVALVTGSTQGLGEGIAREGARVVVNGRSVEKGAAVVALLASCRSHLGGHRQRARCSTVRRNLSKLVFLLLLNELPCDI